MTAAPLTSPTSASAEPPFLPPAGDFCQQRQKSPKTPLETAFQNFPTRVGYDFALTCPTRNRFPGFFRFKGLCLHSFPRCAVARRCPPPRWVPWCSTARVPADISSRRATLSAPRDRRAPDVPHVRKRGTLFFCLRRVTFVSSDKSHQKRRLKLRFKTSSRASAVISRRPVPRATDFPVFPGSKDCASTAFRDALSRDAARCHGGCLGALPHGYR